MQAPVVRWGDPYEALAALEGAVPGLLALRGGAAGRVDWAVVERGLGTALPGDFKLLAEVYPPLLFGDYLSFWTPRPGAEEAWVKASPSALGASPGSTRGRGCRRGHGRGSVGSPPFRPQLSCGSSRSEIELMQYRWSVGVG